VSRDPGPDRLALTTALVCVALAIAAMALWPGEWRIAAGVLGGGALVGLSAWAIRGAVNGLLVARGRPPTAAGVLVKFFTRHVILAVVAYGMMVRLHLDPVGMMAGVSSLVIAAGVAALQRLQRVR
jgi:hypothetical protein